MTYEYEPGTCNINQYQQKRRYIMALVGLVSSGMTSLATYSFNLGVEMVAVFAVLTFIGFEGFYQGRLQFCTGFAQKGIKSQGEGSDTEEVSEEDLAEDRDTARTIHYYSLASALFFTAVFYTAAFGL